MRVFYNENQNVSQNDSFSPSAGKPKQVFDSWKKLNLPFTVGDFKPVTRNQLYQIHDRDYVDGVLDCKLANGFGNRSPQVAKALPWVCASMLSAALHAYKTGETTFSNTSVPNFLNGDRPIS